MLLAAEGMAGSIALIGCDEIAQPTSALLSGWRFREVTQSRAPAPVVTIRKSEQGYCRTAPWHSRPAASPHEFDAAADLARDLVRCYAATNGSLLRLHCAAVEFEQGVAVFLAKSRRRRAALSVGLAAAGARVFADDVLLVDANNEGIAPGLLPRLRLPLSDRASDAFRRFVRARIGPQRGRHAYVRLTSNELAPLGARAPICGIVVLEHSRVVMPDLFPEPKKVVLKELIKSTIGCDLSPHAKLGRLHALVDGAPCFLLRFRSEEQVARLLRDEFDRRSELSAADFAPAWQDSPMIGDRKLYGASHALVIGNAEYAGEWKDLRTPVRDAERIADELAHRGFQVTLKRNLTAEALRRALRTFFAETGADPEARLFLWFAGHGHRAGDEGYLVPTDAPPPPTPEDAFARTALHVRELGDLLRAARSKHILGVIDSCTPCAIFNPRDDELPSRISSVTARPVRQFITAGDGQSYVSDDGRFCNMFLRALRGQEMVDADGDGCITGSELGAFLAGRLPELTDGAQIPRFGKLADNSREPGDFVFSLPRERIGSDSGDSV